MLKPVGGLLAVEEWDAACKCRRVRSHVVAELLDDAPHAIVSLVRDGLTERWELLCLV